MGDKLKEDQDIKQSVEKEIDGKVNDMLKGKDKSDLQEN